MVRRHEEVFANLLKQQASRRIFPQEKRPGPALSTAKMSKSWGGEFDVEQPRRLSGSAVALAPQPGPPLNQSSSPKTGPRVAYFLLWFPEPSQTFVLDEANTQYRLGLDLKVYTLYGARPSGRVAGMGRVLPPVHHLGLASLGTLILDLLRLVPGPPALGPVGPGRNFGPEMAQPGDRGRSLLGRVGRGAPGRAVYEAKGWTISTRPGRTARPPAAWVASRLSGIPFSFSAHAGDIYPPDGALPEKIRAAIFVRCNNQANIGYLAALAGGD